MHTVYVESVTRSQEREGGYTRFRALIFVSVAFKASSSLGPMHLLCAMLQYFLFGEPIKNKMRWFSARHQPVKGRFQYLAAGCVSDGDGGDVDDDDADLYITSSRILAKVSCYILFREGLSLTSI